MIYYAIGLVNDDEQHRGAKLQVQSIENGE